MAEHPFLVFPRPRTAAKAKLPTARGGFRKPTPEQQRVRLDQKFRQITSSFQTLQATIEGVEPEIVLVLETLASSVNAVAKAAARIPGLEWLAEIDLDEAAPVHGFANEKDPAKPLPRRLYALFSSQQAITSLLNLWEAWLSEPRKRAASGFGPFKQLFIHLADIRRWGAQDRIAETGILDAWEQSVAVKGAQGTSLFEVDLWFRADAAKRAAVTADVLARITNTGGQLITSCVIEEIGYHALLIETSSAYIQTVLEQLQQQQYTQLLNAEGVMYFRPHGQSRVSVPDPADLRINPAQKLQDAAPPEGTPVIGILDGMPLTNHIALRDRLLVDDPDDHAALYQAGRQFHGTAMSSLVVHGDGNGDGPPQTRPVYLRPIMHPHRFGQWEITPPEKLLVDLIHRAVRRMFDGEGNIGATAPSVLVINLSIGDRFRPFDKEVSPLARLIDWLSCKYRVLFVVSAGNCPQDITLDLAANDWERLSAAERAQETLRAMRNDQFRRRPLSPAESMNCLTVGASHRDDCEAFESGSRVDLFDGFRAPSPLTTVSSGFRRAPKPEVLFPGGRQLFQRPIPGQARPSFPLAVAAAAPGNLCAAPGVAPMETNRFSYSCGTSNATALATRCAGLAYEVIRQLPLPEGSEPIERGHWPVLLKAILVHGANWGQSGSLLDQAFSDLRDKRDRKRLKQQFLGYGEVDVNRCLTATDQRATLLGWGIIDSEEGQIFELPLPPSLSATTEVRRLTATLAWLSPCNHRHRNYRTAKLYLTVPGEEIGAQTAAVDMDSSRRGTVEHRIFEGRDAKAFLDGATLSIQVSCKADAGIMTESIPYALAVSLEVGANANIDVYQEIRTRIRPRVQITSS